MGIIYKGPVSYRIQGKLLKSCFFFADSLKKNTTNILRYHDCNVIKRKQLVFFIIEESI